MCLIILYIRNYCVNVTFSGYYSVLDEIFIVYASTQDTLIQAPPMREWPGRPPTVFAYRL